MALTLVQVDTRLLAEPEDDVLVAQVHRTLRQEILEGAWGAGDILHEARLSAVYGIDVHAVRRACSLLAEEGLITQHLGASTVASVPLADVAAAYEVRAALEPVAASLAAARIGPANARALRRLAIPPSEQTSTRLVERDKQVMTVLGQATGNDSLAAILARHAVECERVLYLAYREPVAADYSELVDAILMGLGDEASRLAREYVFASRERVVDSLLHDL